MIINIIVFLSCQLEISDSQFNLYNTDESLMMNTLDHHCLYMDWDDGFYSIIPFCIHPETSKKLNYEYKSCYGEIIAFKKLKLINVSIADLFKWNAAIEIIDLYEKYLLLPNLINTNESYCNCSSPLQFGKSCEYIVNKVGSNNKQSFTRARWRSRPSPDNKIRNEYYPHYIGIQCQTNLVYLDWRQICNGVVDCDNGEDEPFELCLQMELNQCNNQTEFRCKNGLCIPSFLGKDLDDVCSDISDGMIIYEGNLKIHTFTDCPSSFNLECDEINIGWKKFFCGDDQFISYSDLTSKISIQGKTCDNQYHLKYLTKLFNSNNEIECWKSMICLTGFDYLYSNITCSYETIENNIKQYCLNEFFFPSNSIVYSFVFFLYEKCNRTNWFNYTGPNYICYNKQYCPNNTLILHTILKNNLTCFYVNQTLFSWTNFYEYIIYLFSSCYSTSLVINNNFLLLYKCNLSKTFISIYRVKDKEKDCYFNEDEYLNIDLCSLQTNDQFKCFTNESECIRESSINDNQYDCLDGSDEYIGLDNIMCNIDYCQTQCKTIQMLSKIYRFEELCDNIVNYHVFPIGSNETDETDCEYWPFKCYNSPYTKCNKIWNCENGLDELQCPSDTGINTIEKTLNCSKNEHYCIKLINNNINMSCIHINKTGDGIIDCIGGSDERLNNICTKTYRLDFEKRFSCMNSSICIKPTQVCDRIINCPFEDDERICPWLFKSNSSKFYCQNSPSYEIDRCPKFLSHNNMCKLDEQHWFCYFPLKEFTFGGESTFEFELYPKKNRISFERQTIIDIPSCNQGYPIQSLISNNNKSICICPPSFYGNHCQYQSERLTVILDIQVQYDINSLTIFHLIIYLIKDNDVIISHDEIIYYYQPNDDRDIKRNLIYLIDERMTRLSSLYQRANSKFVRIDSYIIKQTNVQYISSWFFNVSFSFLPVNRLVVELLLENEPLKILNCKKQCGLHGKCMHYQNLKNKEYCWCYQGWFGDKCHLKSSSNLCNETSCAPHSQCIILNEQKQEFKCICSLGKSGNQCYIKYNSCENIICPNNGTCLPLDQRNFKYICSCTDDDNTTHNCEYFKQISYIEIPANISNLSLIPVIILIMGHMDYGNTFSHESRLIYRNIFLPTTLKMYGYMKIAFIRMYYNKSQSFYYLLAMRPSEAYSINTSVISSNLCPNINDLFNKTILNDYSYLKRLKLYHLPCQQNQDLRCFFDEYRMCICTKDHFSSCHIFDHQCSNCHFCTNDGLCLRQSPTRDRMKYFCLCGKCSFGSICQFSTGNYFITLDILIGTEIKTENDLFNEQPFIIYLVLIILILVVIISLILNIISIIIFSNKKLRQVGCDLYLLYLTIISEIGIILLFLRYLYTIITQIYIIENDLFIKISCIFLEYSVRLIPSIFDWLTVCISIERAYTVMKDIHFTKKIALKTLKLSRWMIFIVILLNILTTFHRPFHLILVDAPTENNDKSGHSWCVLDFKLTNWNVYEKFINIIHLVLPFILNSSSIILFLFRKTNSELTTTIRKTKNISKFLVFKEQLFKYKPLLIGTMTIIILEIPRFIFTFALSCIEHSWQRYLYLTGYLISFLPLTGILFIYIIPSPKYKEQLRITMKKIFCRSLFRNAERD